MMTENEISLKKVNRQVLIKAILVGVIGSIIFNLFFLVFNYFKLIEINFLRNMAKILFGNITGLHWYGKMMLIIVVSLISIIVSIILSMIYFAVLKKFNYWYVGTLYGVFIWIILYVGLPFLFRGDLIIQHHSIHTHINTFCLFILYGTFIGYSISFEYENEMYHLSKK